MRKSNSRVLSFLLSLAMMFSLAAPALAAESDDAFVRVRVDGEQVLYSGGESAGSVEVLDSDDYEIDSVTVNGEKMSANAFVASVSGSEWHLVDDSSVDMGRYKFYASGNTVRMDWSGLRTALVVDVITVAAEEPEAPSDENAEHTLRVTVDGYVSTNVDEIKVKDGVGAEVKFTPASGRSVGTITISDGAASGKIRFEDNNVRVNGKTYSVKRNLNGTVVLTVPAMTGDVDVSVVSEVERHYVNVAVKGNVRSDSTGLNFVTDGDPFAVTFVAKRELASMTLKVETDSGTYRADMYDNYIVVAGKYVPIYRNVRGDVTVSFHGVFSNMTITAESRDAVHEVKVKTDARVTADAASTVTLDDGDDFAITFTPDADREIRTLRVTYDGVVTTVDPKNASYIRVDGMRWDVKTQSDGAVVLYMEDVRYDCEVYATTARTTSSGSGSALYRVNKTLDAHSNLTYTGSSPFYAGEDTRLHIYSDNKYILKSIVISMNGRSATVEPFDTSFKLDGETYYVDWDSNANCYIDVDSIYATINVTVKSMLGTEKYYNGQGSGRYSVTKSAGANSTISYTGVAPFYANESVTVRAQANKNYVLSSVKFTMGNRSATIAPFDTSFTLDGVTYYVDWVSNRDVSVKFDGLTANLTVATKAVKGEEKVFVTTTQPSAPDNTWAPDNTYPNAGQVSGTPSGYHAAYMSGYGDGFFGPDDMMTRAQAITIMCRIYGGNNNFASFAGKANYSDVAADAWYAGYIGYAQTMGYLNGLYGTMTAIEPDRAITRAEFLVLLCTFTNQNLVGVSVSPLYVDTANHWASAYINYCTERNWVSGYGNGLFGPDEALTRAQICVMINRINNRMPGAAMAGYTNNFYDITPNHWAFGDVMEATNPHTVKTVDGGREIWVY